jgi:murein L,D-transpeptidase YafK
MIKIIITSLFIFICSAFTNQSDNAFKNQQLTYSRVKTAYAEKENSLTDELQKLNIQRSTLNIFIRAFKYDKQLEVWVKNKSDKTYQLFKTYSFCASSGTLGPKRKQGDNQTPEGVYYIDRYNPSSNFYLSLGINYPNACDKILGNKYPGGDIFIHGNCVTIGCIPITDDKIKELYILCVEARNNSQLKIPVHIFPTRLNDAGLLKLSKYTTSNTTLKTFWENLKPIYTYFDTKHTIPTCIVNSKGQYQIQ